MSCAKTLLAIGLAFCAPLASAAGGPSWPGDKPIRLIVPYPAGGNADMIGRVFARALGDRLGQTFVVDNRPGAGRFDPDRHRGQGRADGHTLLLGDIATHAINRLSMPNLP